MADQPMTPKGLRSAANLINAYHEYMIGMEEVMKLIHQVAETIPELKGVSNNDGMMGQLMMSLANEIPCEANLRRWADELEAQA